MDDYIIDGRRYRVDDARRILEAMLDDVPDDSVVGLPTDDYDEVAQISEDEDTPPLLENIYENDGVTEEEDVVEEEILENDVITESDTDEEEEDHDDEAEEYYLAKSGMKWNKSSNKKIQTLACNIVREKPGCKGTRPATIKDSFKTFMTDEMLDIIVRETNREAKRVYDEWNNFPGQEKNKIWKEINVTELEAFLGLLICTGAYRSGREDLNELWSEEHGRPIFRATMPLKRFKAIMRFIRFDNKNTREDRRLEDKLAAIRDIWEMFIQKISSSYVPGFDMTIDEQLVGFRGHCPFRQYIKSKPAKYGIKIFWLCDSDTAFPLNGQVYLGKKAGQPREKNQGARVVKDLARKWMNKGRNIVADNFFSSIPLAQDLLSVKTTYVGTLRKNKTEIPKEMQPHRSREVYSSIFGFSGNMTLVSYVPKKSNAVVLLSSMHQEARVNNDEENKPEIIFHYNSKKGAVDTLDKMVATYSCKRNTKRWPLVLFFNILDVAGVAAMITWLFHNPHSFGNKKQKRLLASTGSRISGRIYSATNNEQALLPKRCKKWSYRFRIRNKPALPTSDETKKLT